MKLFIPFISVLVYGSDLLRDQIAEMLDRPDSLLSKIGKLEAGEFVENAIGDFSGELA